MIAKIDGTADFHKKLETTLRIQSSKSGENIGRLRRLVAFDRFLARIFRKEPSQFFLKGGYAMELRIEQSRATKDIDLTCLKRSRNTLEPIKEWILQELQTLAKINLNDHFSYQIGLPQIDIENAPYGGSRHNVSALVNHKPFAEFHLDVGCDIVIDHPEKILGTNWLEFSNIPPPIISMISIEQQFAEKLHSYSLPRIHVNTRSKDLIDLVLLLRSQNQISEIFLKALHRVFKVRSTHPLPEILQKPPNSWEKPFTEMAKECGIELTLIDGFKVVSKFYYELQKYETLQISSTTSSN